MCDGIFPKWVHPDKLPPVDQLMPWRDDNPLTPNEAFFKRMDAIVAAAQENHQLLLIGVYHVDDVSAKRVTSANVGGWTRWLANRYKNARSPGSCPTRCQDAAYVNQNRCVLAGFDDRGHILSLIDR